MKTSSTAAAARLIVCCLGLMAFFTTADTAHATSADECVSDEHCADDEYCGTDKRCHDRPSCDDRDACTIDNYEGLGKCSHTRLEGCESCRYDADCDDANPETIDSCNDGVCSHETPTAPRSRSNPRWRRRPMPGASGLSTFGPATGEVLLQIRPAGSSDILCARMPASSLATRRRRLVSRSRMGTAAPRPSTAGTAG